LSKTDFSRCFKNMGATISAEVTAESGMRAQSLAMSAFRRSPSTIR